MIRRYERVGESFRDRARVAAELMEEARQLTETAMLGADGSAQARQERDSTAAAPAGSANGGGNGNGGNGNRGRSGNGHGRRVLSADDTAAAAQTAAERALASLDRAVAEHPEHVEPLLQRATQLGAMGRYAAARVDLDHALLLDPDNLTVRNALGIVLLRKGLWAQAVPHLRRVVEVESWSPTAWFYLGDALNHVDDLDGALVAFGRAAELDPHHAKALYAQGIVLDRLHRPSDAARLYRRSREVAAR